MKNILKKNQVIIAALAIMIIVAGYLNFTKGKLNDSTLNPNSKTQGGMMTDLSDVLSEDQTDITDTDANANANANGSVENENAGASSNTEVGEAVLANNAIGSDYFVKNKLKREQARAKSETTLKEIINNSNVSDAQKQDAIDQMIELTAVKEKETVTEALLEAKGFADTLVTITDGSVEVVVNANNLTEQQMAQIEDVVKRKTGISAKNIVITPAKVTDESANKEDATDTTAKDAPKTDGTAADTTTKDTETDSSAKTSDDSTKTSADTEQEAGTK